MSTGAPLLSVVALAVATEEDPRYHDPRRSRDTEDMAGLFGGWDTAREDEGDGLLAAYLASVAQYSGAPPSELRMLTAPPDGEDIARTALSRLGPPPGPQPFVLVQASADRDMLSAALPRLVHESRWPVTEDLGLTHLGDLGGTAVVGLVSWWADARSGATALVVDQPLFALAGTLPARLTAVALRFGDGDGPLHVLDQGEGRPPPAADRSFHGPGACGGWPELHHALHHDELRPDDRILVRCGAEEQRSWVLLRRTASALGEGR
ncbi:hypothetical protein [Streptomyces uncialis]|uniref:hypothetical protein n=1 Tax=Streptomyces uncialis TaxID=1048205 RepID=UPI0022509672|nr:hypothetical protein [Streptomyces uncialis]MCX4661906.1 hypothetical protein [Streptomyces uncialis]